MTQSPNILTDFLQIFIPLFVVIDPAGTVPVYVALTSRHNQQQRQRIALRACTVAAITGILFVILGQAILSFLRLSFEDFQIAGGILLVVFAILDLLTPGKPTVDDKTPLDPDDSFGVVPLAVPLIVGPATMTTSLLLVNTYAKTYDEQYGTPAGTIIVSAMVCIGLTLNLILMLLAMWNAHRLLAFVGKNTLAVINKIVMILIAAIAVSLIRRGIVSIVQGMSAPAK